MKHSTKNLLKILAIATTTFESLYTMMTMGRQRKEKINSQIFCTNFYTIFAQTQQSGAQFANHVNVNCQSMNQKLCMSMARVYSRLGKDWTWFSARDAGCFRGICGDKCGCPGPGETSLYHVPESNFHMNTIECCSSPKQAPSRINRSWCVDASERDGETKIFRVVVVLGLPILTL